MTARPYEAQRSGTRHRTVQGAWGAPRVPGMASDRKGLQMLKAVSSLGGCGENVSKMGAARAAVAWQLFPLATQSGKLQWDGCAAKGEFGWGVEMGASPLQNGPERALSFQHGQAAHHPRKVLSTPQQAQITSDPIPAMARC
jgi:hypothetical protein